MESKMTMKSLSDMLGATERVHVTLSDGPLSGVDLDVRKTLPMKDAMQFVTDVVASCVDMENADYSAAAYDFALRMNTIMCYAEINLGKCNMANAYRLVYETDLYDAVADVIDLEQYNALVVAIEQQIDYMRNLLTSTAALKSMEMIGKMDEFAQSAAMMTDQIGKIDFEQMARTFTNGMTVQATSPTQEPLQVMQFMEVPELSPVSVAETNNDDHKVITMKKKKKG